MALNGWHRGENEIHRKLNTIDDFTVARLYLSIDGDLPGDHAHFHCNNLPFLPVTTLDETGRPWGSILAGKEGRPGFITRGPRYSTLRVDAILWDGEPLLENSKLFKKEDQTMLLAGIGIEFGTRRRNKFAGIVSQLKQEDERGMQLDVSVNEAIGNCPKYINIRDLVPHPDTNPSIALQKSELSLKDRLPEEVIAFITASDTVFLGTTYKAFDRDALQFPSHLGMNQRGGRPGFMRVVPSDGRTVVLPDFSGNRFMTSLGNIEATPLASLTFIDFETGDILYLTGHAENLVGADALKLMPFQKTLTTVYVTGYTLVRDALPVRQRQGTSPERSPYSPPIRLLAEESPTSSLLNTSDKATALLTRIDLHAPSIATFTFESSVDLHITPGQAVIMDMSSLVGVPAYRHMAPGKPTSLNDDSIRTWTVSSSSSQSKTTRTFSLTMREKKGGAVTGPLFAIARKLAEVKPEILVDSRPLELRVGIVGVTGDFVLPSSQSASTSAISDADLGLMVPLAADGPPSKKMLWVAGGIGITPFLSMLKALSHADDAAIRWDIRFLLATREPEILVPLVADALSAANGSTANFDVSLEVFSTKEVPETDDLNARMKVRKHPGRMPLDFFQTGSEEVQGREVYLCGSPEFEKAALAALVRGGVVESVVKREGFEY
ncbi:putative PNPOx domain-containing protein [Favolaschia claudopus]|uniref:PNPOx domain-containing protein n=1 Tax=Favolaschia claudopus TaxID=2862362 RepID=A0AAW0A0J1_9AGAR